MSTKKFREWFERYERRISFAAIAAAFVVDSLTLVRVDFFLTNFLLVFYVVIAGAGILLMHLYEHGKLRRFSEEGYLWLFIAVQFCFGGLFGRYLIYYSRSGSFSTSWPFLLILALLVLGNEFVRKHYSRLLLQISFFFLALYFYLIFLIPVLTGKMGALIFLLSGAVSVALIAGFLWLLSRFVRERIQKSKRLLVLCIGAIVVGMNVLYFSNLIPPLPLALHEAGVYHALARTAAGYRAQGEKQSAYAFFFPYETVHLVPGGRVYVYSAVFAPTHFGIPIAHAWQRYDVYAQKWHSESTVTFPITGGADRGYRGYSFRSNLLPGMWRVNIQTVRGQVIGRIKFNIELVSQEPSLVTEEL